MSKIVKNNTNSIQNVSDTGISVAASGDYTIPPQDYDLWSASDDIVELIGDGTVTINDGSEDLLKSDAIRLIQGGYSGKLDVIGNLKASDRIKIDVTGDATIIGPEGPVGAAGFGIYAFAKTQADGTLDKVRGLTINKGTEGIYNYTFTTPTPDVFYSPVVALENVPNSTDTNSFITNKTVNGFTVTIGVGDNGTSPDVVQNTDHTISILGEAGPQGITSAYEAWLSLGNVGTEQDFLDTLIGPQGIQGEVGPQGIQGETGPQGIQGETGPQGIQGPTSTFGTEYQRFESLGSSSTTSSSYVQKASFNTTTLPIGEYYIRCQYSWRQDFTSDDFRARLQINNSTTLFTHQEEPQDGGVDQSLWFRWDDVISVASSGSLQLDVDFSEVNGGTATIANLTILLWRVS